ncbi:hypothetical protein HJG53_10790 [Sphingomonas sp. ID1715]|uniref:hypothetical protein n=1 Tax=Sphingomonas sp. ID1715 TaxID=1656898 RepID=UPI0014896ACC|nr:hypothetical protein [Sphingomonas sp. ID1715]NNM77391.1 hypothetical protein [Sphingomonas sp. ID1715]
MKRETRGWSAVVRPGAVPKLIVRGEVCTHPYAQAFLKEGRSRAGEPDILCLTLAVLADTPRAELKEWTRVRFEKPLLARDYGQVRIAGTGASLLIDVRQPVAND